MIASPSPGSRPLTVAPAPIRLSERARLARDRRRVVRRHVRLDLAAGQTGVATDGVLTVIATPVTPRRLAWRADRPVAVVVLHTGCGMRLLGEGGLAGDLRLPAVSRADSFLAFCYDEDADGTPAATRLRG